MSANNTRSGIATIVATAAVTLAIGVTIAALTGHLAPRPAVSHRVTQQPTTAVAATERAELPAPTAPNVVLVPVSKAGPAAGPAVMPVMSAAPPDIRVRHRDHDNDDDDGYRRREREHDDD